MEKKGEEEREKTPKMTKSPIYLVGLSDGPDQGPAQAKQREEPGVIQSNLLPKDQRTRRRRGSLELPFQAGSFH